MSALDLWTRLDRIGSEWTLSHFLQSLTFVDVPGLVRHNILGEARTLRTPVETKSPRVGWKGWKTVDDLLTALGIAHDRRTEYLACLYTQYEGLLARRPAASLTFQAFALRWLLHEREMMRRFVPLYFGVAPRLDGIRHAAALRFGEDGAKTLPGPVSPSRSAAKGGRG